MGAKKRHPYRGHLDAVEPVVKPTTSVRGRFFYLLMINTVSEPGDWENGPKIIS